MQQREITVNLNVPLIIREVSDNTFDVVLSDTTIGVIHKADDGYNATITHFPKTIRMATSHDNLHSDGDTLENCAGNLITKIMNIMLNRYRFEAKAPKKRIV